MESAGRLVAVNAPPPLAGRLISSHEMLNGDIDGTFASGLTKQPPPLHLPACHPSCLTCSGPSQADCVSCPSLASLQDGHCRTTCQDGRFLLPATGECLSKWARGRPPRQLGRLQSFIRASSVWCLQLDPRREPNPQPLVCLLT